MLRGEGRYQLPQTLTTGLPERITRYSSPSIEITPVCVSPDIRYQKVLSLFLSFWKKLHIIHIEPVPTYQQFPVISLLCREALLEFHLWLPCQIWHQLCCIIDSHETSHLPISGKVFYSWTFVIFLEAMSDYPQNHWRSPVWTVVDSTLRTCSCSKVSW